jgi:hypothetical protein
VPYAPSGSNKNRMRRRRKEKEREMLQLFLLCPHMYSVPCSQTLPSLRVRDKVSNPCKTAE